MLVDGNTLRFRVRDFQHVIVPALPLPVTALGTLVPWLGSAAACQRLLVQGGLRLNGEVAAAGRVVDRADFTDGVLRVSRGRTINQVTLVLLPDADTARVYWEVNDAGEQCLHLGANQGDEA